MNFLNYSVSIIVNIICLCLIINKIDAYNLDLGSFIRHGGSPNSMFGFSIALHKYITNWIIVGAPRSNTSYYQPGVERSGAVYKCDIQDDNRCLMVPFDSKGNQFNDRGEQIDTKSDQWLGASVSSGGENGPIVACAPRYVFHTMQPRRVERVEPVGTCFTSRNFTVFTEYSPCRTNYWGYHRQGSCQAGFSAALTKKGDRLFIGAPGSWYWQGQIFSIHTDAKFPYKPPLYQDFGAGGQTYSYDITDRRNNVYSTGESYSSDDDSYLGYSMITGDFNGDGEDDVAVGMPRGAGLLGKVVLFKWNVVNQLNMTGRQIGAYFGYSLCAVDVDGDNLEDLVVGAPMYTIPNNEGKYDVGRVYIMLQGQNGKFEKMEIRDGINSKGRFGLALTTLGDINQDGYGDFAVGAPYDGPHGRGAVYIFHGSKNGPLPKHSQVIYSEDIIGTSYPRTFGFSLAGGMDLDGNLYPDLAVGAYESDSVLVFKSRPVAVIDASTTFSSSTSKLLSLDDKKCTTYRDGKRVTCTEINSCLKYSGYNLPSVLDFDVSWVLDAKKLKTPRMFFLLDEGKNVRNSTIRLERGKVLCRNETVFIVDNIRDKLTPLEVEMRYQLRGSKSKPVVRRKRDILEPVIDQNREIVQRDSINIQKNCGPDNICVPDLQLTIKTVDKFLLGSKDPLEIDVLISNRGEDAFEAGFYMVMPEDLNFKKIQQIGDPRDTPITCTAPNLATNYTLKCDIGNPLPAGKVANFKVVMMSSQKSTMAPSYEIFMEANSTNVEKDGSNFDNIIKKSINIWIKTDLAVEGTSLPEFDHYKASEYSSYLNATSENDLGPQVVHIYNIRNNGPSLIEEAEVYIHWPYKTENGDILMYMLQEPYTVGNIRCDPSIHVNPRNLILDKNLANKNYLESKGIIVKNFDATNNYQTGVRIDKSHSVSSSNIHETSSGSRVLTESEKKKLAEEENIESVGDASLVHNQRAQDAVVSGGQGTYGGQTSHAANSWNLSSQYGGKPIIVTTSKNRTVTFDENGNEHVVESSTKYYHDIDGYRPYDTHNRAYTNTDYNNNNRDSIHRTVQNEYNYNPAASQNRYNEFSSNLDKMAQGGHEFQVGAIGLQPLPTRNLDDELKHDQQFGGYSQGNSYSSQSRHQGENVNYGPTHHKYIPSGNENTASVRHYVDDNSAYDNKDQNYETHSSSHQSSSSSSYGSKENFGEYNQNHHHHKRDVNVNDGTILNTPCKSENCGTLRCVVSRLGNNDGAWIVVRTRLVAATMKHLSENIPLNVSTMAVANVTRLPYIGVPQARIFKSHEIYYKAIPEPIPTSDMVPVWIVVLSACAGVLILLLLVYLLYKCGFFKRNRPSDHSQERQPLNTRNGYHGDEHL